MELLQKMYAIHSPSGGEKPLRKFVRKWVNDNIEGVTITHDNVGNIYMVKGVSDTYPCVVAHLDQVQRHHSADFETFIYEGAIYGWSASRQQNEGLGADDKNGVWVALRCLQKFDVMKVALFNSEEVGCVGSASADMDFFKDCRFVIQPDRKGKDDLITEISCGRICSDDFLKSLDADLYGYMPEYGFMTDVLQLSENGVGLSCINVSCGYYQPHTDQEYTVIDDLLNCYNFICHIIEKCTDVYPHNYERYSTYTGAYSGGRYGSSYSSTYDNYKHNDYDDSYYDDYYRRCYNDDYDYYGYSNSSVFDRKPYIPDPNVFSSICEWIDEYVAWNFEDFWPEELWDHAEILFEDAIDKATFIELAEQSWQEYYELL